MAMKLYEENDIQNIANELRRYNETDNKYRVEDMTLGIQDITENIEYKLGTTRTIEGINSLEYENAKAYRTLDAEYQGNVKQDSTTGANLCNLNVVQDSRVICNSDGTITINGAGGFSLKHSDYTFKANTTYYMKWELVSGSVNQEQIFMVPDATSFAKKDTFAPFKFDSDTVRKSFWIHDGASFTNAIIRIWFSENQTDFEPYTNGPSPNPDYPQEVQTLKGWNLFDKDKLVQGTWNHTLGTMSQRVTIWSNEIKKGDKYTITNYDTTNFSFATGVSNYNGYNEQAIGTDDSGWYTSKTYTITASQDGYLLVQIRRADNSNVTPNDIPKDLIQIVEGTEPKPYLPYNSIGIKRVGKNRLNITTFTDGTKAKTTNGITATINDDNSITLKGTATAQTYFYLSKNDFDLKNGNSYFWCNSPSENCRFEFVCVIDGTTKYLNSYGTPNTFSKNNSFVYSGSNINIANGTTVNVTLKPMVANGMFKDYESYTEKIDYIDLQGNELLTTDKLKVDSKGNVKLIKNWGKVVLDGSEDYYKSSNNLVNAFGTKFNLKLGEIQAVSSHFKYEKQGGINLNSINKLIWNTSASQTYIVFSIDSEQNNVESLKTWLSVNKPIVYYRLAAPEEIDLGTIEPIRTLNGTNNIEILATLKPTHMKETYMLDIQNKYLPKMTTEETSIDYVAQFPLDITIEGNIKQETTTGKNLFDESIMPTNTMNGIKWEYTNKKIKISGIATDTYSHNENIPITLQAGTYYFVESVVTNLNFSARFYNIDGTLIANSQQYNPFTISENATRIELLVKGMTSGTSYNQEINFMVSTTNGEYEPYTGGQSSPSPDYPQEIKTIENSLKITSCNKNLFDINDTKSDFNASVYKYEYNLKPNTQYTISSNCPSSNTANIYANSTSSDKKVCINNPQTITSGNNGYFYILVRHVGTSEDSRTFNVYQTILDGRYWLQLEESDQPTPYEQHLETQITANLPEGEFIGKINDTYKDTLKVEYNEDDGQYHLVLNKMIGKVVLDLNTIGIECSHNDGTFQFKFNKYLENTSAASITKCSHSKYWNNNFSDNGCFVSYQGFPYLLIKENDFGFNNNMTIEEAINKLKQNISEITYYYSLFTSYEVDLGIVDKIIPFEGTNNIEVIATLEPSKIQTTYYLDAKKYIEDTTSALLELGGEN